MLGNNKKEYYKAQIQAIRAKIKDHQDQIRILNNDILTIQQKINER